MNDLLADVKYRGHYQTMSTDGFLTVAVSNNVLTCLFSVMLNELFVNAHLHVLTKTVLLVRECSAFLVSVSDPSKDDEEECMHKVECDMLSNFIYRCSYVFWYFHPYIFHHFI